MEIPAALNLPAVPRAQNMMMEPMVANQEKTSAETESSARQDVGSLVLGAIRKLKGPNGSTLREVKKYLSSKDVDVVSKDPEIKLYVKRALDKGILEKAEGKYKAAARRKRSKGGKKSVGGKKRKSTKKSRKRKSSNKKGRKKRSKRNKSKKIKAAEEAGLI